MSHVAIGRNGKKNCRVRGISNETNKRVEIAVFPKGPGDCMTLSEKIPTIVSSRYWKS
jgi:hypothetical protein